MAARATPTAALERRHAAAMAIIHDLPSEQRGLPLLLMVLVGSPLIDAAVEAAEHAGTPMPRPRGRKPRVLA